jgi:protein TonB
VDFSQTQRDPTRKFVGLGAVVVFHIIIVYALITGLARKVVEVVKGPIEVKVIEEVIKKPPPPPELLPPPPKLQAPPPPFIPPPEINIQPPPTPAPTITAVTPEAPPAPQAPVIAPPPPAPAPPTPAVQSAAVVCPNYREALSSVAYPREAALENIQGEVLAEFTLGANGQIRDIVIKSSTNRVFNKPAIQMIQSRLTCKGQGQDVKLTLPISFKLN